MKNLTHINQSNIEYIEKLYFTYLQNPESLDNDWRLFFDGVAFSQNLNERTGLSEKELSVHNLIHAYRNYGFFEANLNPLSNHFSFPYAPVKELELAQFNLNEADLDLKFKMAALIGKPDQKLRDIITTLRSWYCGTLAIQCSEALPSVRKWFYGEFEKIAPTLSSNEKKDLLLSLTRTEALEKFLHTRFVGKKRFSLEGADTLIVMLEGLVPRVMSSGGEEIVIGMAHRGRINVLANFMGKALEIIFAEFDEYRPSGTEWASFEGDVKYHLGFNSTKDTPDGPCHISLAFNPSHLEAVCPVVCGITRAKQRRRFDTQLRKKVIPILIHGDASVAGQGVVAETFQLSRLQGYQTGGTIHIVLDNQVAFTANPLQTRSSVFASDISKMLHTPVIHCNGDHPESCIRAIDLALRYRQASGRDIVINLVCYRRHGHNEGDEPAFTQPLMYEALKKHPTTRQLYTSQLINEGLIDSNYSEEIFKAQLDLLSKQLEDSRAQRPKIETRGYKGLWQGLKRGHQMDLEKIVPTGVNQEFLLEIGQKISSFPPDFTPHPKIVKLLESRLSMIQGNQPIDWGMAELLCYGSLIKEGTPIRLSGQDVARGTFSHRHSVLHDAKNGETYCALNDLNPQMAKPFCVYDSPLSEMAVLGFEYGNSISDPWYCTIWEAQFGDFSNGAQIIIDQFIVSGEVKWLRSNGLILLLPHGYEGQGPEHSSARLERFLQLCAQDNIQVCNLTTPAQIFHVIRRQMKRDFRKPLFIMTPKSLLRHPKVVSPISDFSNSYFREVLPDLTISDTNVVETVILCSGKVYYDLLQEKELRLNPQGNYNFAIKPLAAQTQAIVRIEQLYPFPEKQLASALKNFKNLKRVLWLQEEPKNMGAYSFIFPRVQEMMEKFLIKKVDMYYIGRTERGSTATGSSLVHKEEQQKIIQSCFQW